MHIVRCRDFLYLCMLTAVSTLLAWAPTANAKSALSTQQTLTIDPSDPRLLMPNPIESSDEGTAWKCRSTGSDAQCTGALATSWQLQDGPGDWCRVPLYSINGTFTRIQDRYYTYDASNGQYLEYERLVHPYSDESWTPVPDPASTQTVTVRMNMTWLSTFQIPGDLDSRVTRKQGIDTLIKLPNGGIVTLDVGQKTTILGDDFNFRGRWDIALGDPSIVFGKICSALGV
jgi:hypothetical protein